MTNKLALKFTRSIGEIGAQAWNELAGTDEPFTRYEFLAALEETGCTTAATGWQPSHVLLSEPGGDGRAVAILPLYRKTNSWGEYVFDWAWANAYERHGENYYPKFVSSIPFTPSTGRRLLVREGHEPSEIVATLKAAISDEAERGGLSSWHILFPGSEEQQYYSEAGLLSRVACQFQWTNRDYRDFDDFLSHLNSRKRKNIRKERKRLLDAGIHFRWVEGADIDADLWDKFYGFYQSTYLIRGMQGYLTPEFFRRVARDMPEQTLMVCAEKGDRVIAAALFFKSQETLYGRYWGSDRDYQFLHFETCYYQGQEYAIANGLRRFDSGAQGEHKIQRGFEPVLTHSSHWLAHPAFADAIAEFLREERQHIQRYREQAAGLLPYKEVDD